MKNVWHCKGACGRGGDVIEWVMRAEGVSFRHAVELLERTMLPFSSGRTAAEAEHGAEAAAADRADRRRPELLLQVVGYYTRR